MKNFIKLTRALTLFLTLTASISINAESALKMGKIGDCYYYGWESTKTCSAYGHMDGDTITATSITIPSTVEYNGKTYNVTCIAFGGFKECKSLVSVTIEEGITELGYGSFSECSALSEISLPQSLLSINTMAFAGTNITSIIIPGGVTLEGRALGSMEQLKTVVLQSGITTIPNGCFSYCEKLDSLIIPSTVDSLGKEIVSDCDALQYIAIKGNVTKIHPEAFSNAYAITQISVLCGTKDNYDVLTFNKDIVDDKKHTEFSVTTENSYTWRGTEYTSSGDYVKTLQAADGCDSIVTLHLTIVETAPAQKWANGILPGRFSVAADHLIQFSQGNLQYQASTNAWRFAGRQYFYVGDDTEGNVYSEEIVKCSNASISPTYAGWIDLFGWGTGNNPTLASVDNSDYGTFVDWGINAISNGGNTTNMWRTLSSDELSYLFHYRTNCNQLHGPATVNGILGEIILPDNWGSPSGIDFVPNAADASVNVYTASEWITIEEYGAVFLPLAGYRDDIVNWPGTAGHYWLAGNDICIYRILDTWDGQECSNNKYEGNSVRLIMDVAYYSLSLTAELGAISVQDVDNNDVNLTNPIPSGTRLTIQVTPFSGYNFVQWSDGNTDNPRIFTLVSDSALTVQFEEQTESQVWQQGKLPGVFSVAVDKQVCFSQGNLRYRASDEKWKFASRQVEYVGIGNTKISDSYAGWIDLFGWGTGNNPTFASIDYSDYGTFVDWGINAISNGGNTANMWRTLTRDEWVYLFEDRTNANSLRGRASINGIHCYLLLPDEWTIPGGLSFTPDVNDWASNTYTADQWAQMEAAGAVCLPIAGCREGVTFKENGYYWSSSVYESGNAYSKSVQINNTEASPYTLDYRDHGLSVRLVRDTILCEDKTFEFSEVARGSYKWNGITYNTSGNYQQTFALATGCDSIVTLHLSIYSYCVAGNGTSGNPWCDEMYWLANGSPMLNNTITFQNVPAGTYEFKITDGQWGNGHEWAFGSVDATCSSANVLNGGDNANGNIKLITSITQDITISFDGTHICVTGTFDDPNSVVISEYTVVGDFPLMGSGWNLDDANNTMTLSSPGIYTLTKNNLNLTANAVYNYKVVGDHDYVVYQLPASGNNTLEVNESGEYDVVFTLNLNVVPNSLTAVATKVTTTDLENGAMLKGEPRKLLRDGQLFIIRDGRTYNAQGQRIR